MAQMTPEELKTLMDSFYGTTQYHNYGTVLCTDGMHAVAQEAGAGWLVSDIAITSIFKPKVKALPIAFWRLTVKADKTALLECKEDIPGKTVYRQKYEYTDFPMGEWKFYYQRGVLMVPNEY